MGSGVSTQTVEIQSLSTKDLTGEERLQLERDEEERARDELFDRLDKAHSKLLKQKTLVWSFLVAMYATRLLPR